MVQGGRWHCAARWIASGARGLAISLIAAGCLGFGHPASAGAGECRLPADMKNVTIDLDQRDARAELVVTRPNSAGRKFRVENSDEMYVGKFDPQGRAVIAFALIAPSNEISIRLAEMPLITCKIDVPEFSRLYRVVVRWRDPVQLDLDVVEPGRQPGGFGHINRGHANTDLRQGLGQLDMITDPSEDGATGELSYVVANAAALLATGIPTLRLDYASRGARPEPPFCGEHARASIPFELYVINHGEVKRSNFSTARARCGEPMADSSRLMRLRY